MLSRTENVSIATSDEIEGKVSISLFDVTVEEAIRSVAQAAGYAVERRGDAYVVVEFADIGQDVAMGATRVRAFKIQYSDPEKVREILEKHLSRYGEITSLEERNMVVVEDLPDFLNRLARILEEIDRQPKQVLLEARVLEIQLDDNDNLGVDWSRLSTFEGTDLTIGLSGLTGGGPGLFFDVLNNNLQGAIEALSDENRLRALATPQLLTMENQEARVLIGDRLGYRLTTTINQVTTESVEFIDTGVTLRFTPSVDREGRILLKLSPEVSSGSIADGIPEVTTTEVETQLLVEDGEQVFIGGLIRDFAEHNRRGVPLLSRIPGLRLLFGASQWLYRSTETVTIVRATVRPKGRDLPVDRDRVERLDHVLPEFEHRRRVFETEFGTLRDWEPDEISAEGCPGDGVLDDEGRWTCPASPNLSGDQLRP
jgi:type II secretory pathway component GspD/PulD (secretin)